MLKELYIKNLAIIEEANIPFTDDFNVFTGETGAGKSILINGINAVLGQRITKDIVRAGCDKAVVSALFTDLSRTVCEKLNELGISSDDNQITLSREMSADGGSVARVNSRVSSVSVLKEIGSLLVSIHGQHDNQILMNPDRHIDILDSYGDLGTLKNEYQVSFRKLQECSRKLKQLTVEKNRLSEKENYLVEVIEEIAAVRIEENEDEILSAEFKIVQNSESIINSLSKAYWCLNGSDDGDEPGAAEHISTACGELSYVSDSMESVKSLYERLESAKAEINDIISEISMIRDRIDIDPGMYELITTRLSQLNRIKKKYGPTLDDVLETYRKAEDELERIEISSDDIVKLSAEREGLLHEVSEKAKRLSTEREKAASRFAAEVEAELQFLDMQGVVIRASIEKGNLTSTGMDTVEFLISTNRGEGMKPLSKIASGGELSRIMLALKNVISEKDGIHTLIFDEIDTGVSGRAAQKIGIKLKKVSASQQVICVTHLSQLAVMADNHLLIEKKAVGDRTCTSVQKLDFDERKKEIARIMVGADITETALKNAEEMLKNVENQVN